MSIIGEFCQLALDVKVNIILAICSFILAAISIIFVLITLQQNKKMIEASTRPYLQIYPAYMDSTVYIIIKNFGASDACINEIYCNHQFTPNELYRTDSVPDIFSQVKGAILPPGYDIKCPLHSHEVAHINFKFKVIYHSGSRINKLYNDEFSFVPVANNPFANTYPSGETSEDHLHNIAKELRNISRSKL